MKIRRAVLVCMIGLFSWGLAGGVAVVLRTIGIYSGACEKLSGFPGVLQAAGFVPGGTCRFEFDDKNSEQVNDKNKDKDKHRKKHCPPNECRVDGRKGECVEETHGRETVCFCKPVKVSRH